MVHHWSPVTAAVPSGVSFVLATAASWFQSGGLTFRRRSAYCWGFNGTANWKIRHQLAYTGADCGWPPRVSHRSRQVPPSRGPDRRRRTVYCCFGTATGRAQIDTPTAIQQTGLTFADMLGATVSTPAPASFGAAIVVDNYQGDLGQDRSDQDRHRSRSRWSHVSGDCGRRTARHRAIRRAT